MNNPITPLYAMSQLQSDLNSKVNPEWLTAEYDWLRASWLECAELMDSTAWKWWKHQAIDTNNIQVEMIDIFHFLLSSTIEFTEGDLSLASSLCLSNLKVAENKLKDMPPQEGKEQRLIQLRRDVETLASNCLSRSDQATLWQLWGAAWFLLGKSLESLYTLYMTKNVLNVFRQDHGYKDGSYRKCWEYGGEQMEDNEAAYRLANGLDVDLTFAETLTARLLEVYNTK